MTGTGGCRAYDTDPSALQPFCGNSSGPVANAPAWCFDSFCYVDRNNCSLRNSLTGVFPDSGTYQYSCMYSLLTILRNVVVLYQRENVGDRFHLWLCGPICVTACVCLTLCVDDRSVLFLRDVWY